MKFILKNENRKGRKQSAHKKNKANYLTIMSED